MGQILEISAQAGVIYWETKLEEFLVFSSSNINVSCMEHSGVSFTNFCGFRFSTYSTAFPFYNVNSNCNLSSLSLTYCVHT